ncbi:MAG: ABC transporter permease [Bryobacteraceae bacterium]
MPSNGSPPGNVRYFMFQDAVFTFRSLRRQPGFFAVAVVTLALGVASTTAVFSLFYQVLLRTLPVPAPRELVVFHADGFELPGGVSSDNSETVFSYPMYTRLRDGAPNWQGIAARSSASGQLVVDGAAERVRVEIVSGNFFETLKLTPVAGRLFNQSDDSVRGGNPVAVVSYGFFQRRFGGKNTLVGAKITVSGQPFEVIGVAPERFRGFLTGNDPEIYLPISMRATLTRGWNNYDRPSARWLTILGRLPANGDTTAIGPLFSAIVRDHVEQAKITNANRRQRIQAATLTLAPAATGLNEPKRQWERPLVVLLIMVALLLLIACANLANLLLARGVNRAREISIRVSVGATRGQIIQLLLLETAAITATGAALGAAFAPVLVNLLIRAISDDDGGSGWLDNGLSLPVLAFSIGLAGLCTLLAGLVPAWQISRPAVRRRTGRTRHFFVGAQVALSLVLLTVAGLFGRSLSNLLRFDPGFQANQLALFTTNPGLAGYDVPRGVQFAKDVERRLAALPGVRVVSYAEWGPLQNSTSSGNIQLEGYRAGEEENMDCNIMAVGPRYFQALGTAVISGRAIKARDSIDAPKVAVVNQAFVKRFLKPGENVIGRHMSIGAGNIPLDIEIVGVAADTKHQSLRETVKPTFFRPLEQAQKGQPRAPQTTFFMRSSSAVPATAIRAAVAQSDPLLPVYNLRTMEKAVDAAIVIDRLIAGLAVAFGGLALSITAIGLYGVLSYLTRRRTTEFGIRMALGATRGNILRLVFREVLLLVGAGALVGAATALGTGQAIAAQLFGVNRFDPLVLIGAPLLLALVALAAASLPSLKAAAVQPLEALRHE